MKTLLIKAIICDLCIFKNNHSIRVDLWELYKKFSFFSNETFLF
ncbi:MAG: hypothetical protein RLZZ577_714 [Bacteroidota bacterium]|jgi:hypothetical protein